MKISEAEKQLTGALQHIYEAAESRNIALLVLEACTGYPPAQLRLHKEESLSTDQQEILRRHLARLQQHEPVQYVLEKCWFYGMELYVDKNVLIPRPETEELVHWIVTDVKAARPAVFEKRGSGADATTELKILDVGTGSGCIALALKKAAPRAEVWGCDVSEDALNVARRNGALLNIRVDFQGTDFLQADLQKSLPRVDLLVSNPPYIPLREKTGMRPNVVAFEPHTALFVPDANPLLFYEAIARFAHSHLSSNGSIYLEIHEGLADGVVALFRRAGYAAVELKKDMQGKDRMVRIKKQA